MDVAKAKTLILGLGNSILSDDGVGPAVAYAIEKRIDPRTANVVEASLGGLDLLDLLAGYKRVIIIDAIKTKDGKAGQIHRLNIGTFSGTRHAGSPHDINLATALEMGKKLGIKMPSEIDIYAIEAEDTESFSEACTPAVAAAIPRCAGMILKELAK